MLILNLNGCCQLFSILFKLRYSSPKNNFIVIYSPSCHSRPIWLIYCGQNHWDFSKYFLCFPQMSACDTSLKCCVFSSHRQNSTLFTPSMLIKINGWSLGDRKSCWKNCVLHAWITVYVEENYNPASAAS